MSGVDHVLAVLRPRREKRAELLAGEGAVPVHLGDLYTESGHTLQGSFSAVSKQAGKQASKVVQSFSKPNFASKYSLEYSLESSRRDLHNALLYTVL